jgi:ABC-type polysaccharide/polyol phosphate transport system ATPase subunit
MSAVAESLIDALPKRRMTAIIQFDNVSKRFKINRSRPRSFQEALVQRHARSGAEVFWALRDVSFSIEAGERSV